MREKLTHRDLSALSFYDRVLGESAREDAPLLERARFIGIAGAGLAEFQRVRLPRLGRGIAKEAQCRLDGLYAELSGLARALTERLAGEEIRLLTVDELPESDRAWLQAYVTDELQPGMAEVAPEKLAGGELTLARMASGEVTLFSLPQGQPRLIRLRGQATRLVPVEQAAAYAMDVWPLMILRDEHFSCGAKEKDVRVAVGACLKKRQGGRVIRLLVDQNMDDDAAGALCGLLGAEADTVRRSEGMFDPGGVMREIAGLEGYAALRFPKVQGRDDLPADLFGALRERDRLLIHPYDSFEPVVRWLEQAARDEAVESIAMTLYRVSEPSRVAEALKEAAKRGKRVTAVVEVRSRGDEERNLRLADDLTRAGCRVLTGPPGCKVHAKVTVVTRREHGELRRYAHMGTGNYNEQTAQGYTDVGLLTAQEDMTRDAESFFSAMERGEGPPDMQALTASPEGMRAELTRLIRREMGHAAAGRACGMTIKLNALTDRKLIAALTEASEAGVPVHLIVRGACRLRPVAGGRIAVRSLVGRFLEHARVFRFVNGGEEELFISSADWMPRSLDRRVELLIPIREAGAAAGLARYLEGQLRDTSLAWSLCVADYTAARCCVDELVDSQAECLKDWNSLR